jgi:uncharacterized membrane protein
LNCQPDVSYRRLALGFPHSAWHKIRNSRSRIPSPRTLAFVGQGKLRHIMHRNVETWERVVSVIAGAGLLAAGWRRGSVARRAATTVGTSLIARGVAGYCPVIAATGRGRVRDDTRHALGGARGVFVQETVTIDAPVRTLFELWRDPSNLPQLLPDVERVDVLDDRRSHWVVQGPAASVLEWDAEIINEVPFEIIGWRSLPGADVASAGSVRFRSAGVNRTQITVTMQYAPLAGRAGATAAWLTGYGVAGRVREALKQLKQQFEGQRGRSSEASGVPGLQGSGFEGPA